MTKPLTVKTFAAHHPAAHNVENHNVQNRTPVAHRYITDALTTGPMGLLSRVVSTNDTLMGLLPLIDRPPWVRQRRGKGGGTEKWIGNGWNLIPPGDRFKLTPADVQVGTLAHIVSARLARSKSLLMPGSGACRSESVSNVLL